MICPICKCDHTKLGFASVQLLGTAETAIRDGVQV